MPRITEHIVYKTSDGVVHWSLAEAQAHDAEITVVDAIMAFIGSNRNIPHGTFVKRDIDAVWAARRTMVARYLPDLLNNAQVVSALNDRTLGCLSGLGRRFYECTSRPVRLAWSRLECIDKQGREWEQPYFVLHPEEGRGEAPAV